eukprot:9095826-Ditylum_brightwellii.AAC.1
MSKKGRQGTGKKDKKTGPAGHTHVTTDGAPKYDEGDEDEEYGNWGSVSIGGFMFHQHGKPSTMHRMNTVGSKWTDATNH